MDKYSFATFLSITKAFDSVWQHTLFKWEGYFDGVTVIING